MGDVMERYVRNHWYAAALSTELSPGSLVRRVVLGEAIVLFKAANGRISALEDRCPHRNVALSMGHVAGHNLQCGYHGLQFDGMGQCVAMPGQVGKPSGQLSVRRYAVADRHGYLWIWTGDPDQGEVDLIPDYSWQSDSGWAGTLHWQATKCNYRLALENVLDLSHATFVHQHTVGSPEVAETPADVIKQDKHVEIVRRFDDMVLPKFYQKATGLERARRVQSITYFDVNCVRLDVTIDPAGNVDPAAVRRLRFGGPYTPELPGSHLHFSSAYRDFDLENESLTGFLIDAIKSAYCEDIPFLESQQSLIDSGHAQPNKLFAVDKGPVLAMRMLDQRIADEDVAASPNNRAARQ
ncbi:aromatic ring-hydroxylating dioxygenase subunit alpha [Sphingopyxis terrae]|uniref:aromatic ring-hydroxylating dioxygenase subunit alpha n=1 Tax=Sphingopyxis terrae TaxID=33052 RepID=UPI002A17188C|nr:aromatic ring-hydroxylating dioxygenase subunit alpha [Sphingopyxis terrae]MDX8356488.1 aromatic ring-hydroxylating dioxygenase subunit alpha [Sphingopyxis terrae]